MSDNKTQSGGERGIRTLDRVLTYTPLAGERLQPLGHLSIMRDPKKIYKLDQGEFNIILISVQHNFIIISVSQNTFYIISRFPIRDQLYPVNDF